ncbi:ubiquitin related modifier 1 [Meira miltonrushii]|uniref:Ubiquitin-related modifier 1 n=1 Tax=Meira miltonrushii TaxID=1280837 RepID=A0A316VGJ8_9BASI|nr:ubiquitin related modifier 1 [Meira miltonrushii]PWN36656.1 ubiquitin related modifier 1 [Meira miltonrushii]
MSGSSIPLLKITVELGGGTELLTANKKLKKHILQVPAEVFPNELSRDSDKAAGISDGSNVVTNGTQSRHPATMSDLIQLVCRDVIVERHGMLVESDGSMKPGILVLINDADWELEGEMEYELQDGDQICLISTLHGG